MGPIRGNSATGVTPAGQPRGGGVAFRFAHILTPETDTSTHYFWALCRDFKKDDVALDRMVAAETERIFTNEDEWMLEAVQEVMGTTDLGA